MRACAGENDRNTDGRKRKGGRGEGGRPRASTRFIVQFPSTKLTNFPPSCASLLSLLENEMAPELLVGKRFLELGCGCGILGLAMALISNGRPGALVPCKVPRARPRAPNPLQ